MKGPKPQSLDVARRKNNPGKRPLNHHAPTAPTIDPAIPDELRAPIARAEWVRIVGALAAGHVTTIDRATLIGYCTQYGHWQTLEAVIAKEPPIITRGKITMPNPVIALAVKAYTLMLKTAAELGITPSTRARIVVAHVPEAIDDFNTYQQRRRLTVAK